MSDSHPTSLSQIRQAKDETNLTPSGAQQSNRQSAFPTGIGKVWVVLPAFNEQEAIRVLLEKIVYSCSRDRRSFEVVVIDDASTDDTARIVSELTFNYPVTMVQHSQNQGLAGAIRTGLTYAIDEGQPGDVVVTLDADDTQPPATIPLMLTRIEEGCDVVVASRYQPGSRTIGVPVNRLGMTFFAKWLFKIITPITGIWDYTCGFRAYKYEALEKTATHYGEEFVSEKGFSCMVDVLLKMRRFDFVFSEVPMLLRYDQKSGPSKMKVASTAVQTICLLVKRRFGR